MDKAVKKKAERDKEKVARAEKKAKDKAAGKSVEAETPDTPTVQTKEEKEEGSEDEMFGLSYNEDAGLHQISPTDSSTNSKRKREEEGDFGSPKKTRTEQSPAPPPPPPPPAEDMPLGIDEDADSFHGSVEEMANGVWTNASSSLSTELVTERMKRSDDISSPMQLATPPTTNGKEEAATNSRSSIAVNGGS